MDLTPFLATSEQGTQTQEEGLESIHIPGRIAVVSKGRFLLRALCRSFGGYSRITCAVTDQQACLDYLAAEADFVEDQQPLQAAVMAVLGGHSYRSPSLHSGTLPYLSCPRLTQREYEVLDLLASGLSDREIAKRLVVSDETAHTYTKRLLQTLNVHNRLQAVLKGMRCGMVQI